jgi:hypothetical protein
MQENGPLDGSSSQKPKKTGKKRTGRARHLRKLKSSRQKSAVRRPDTQEPERHFYWVADGQTNIGFVEQIDKTYKALSADERELGRFDSLTAAADAVSTSSRRDRPQAECAL